MERPRNSFDDSPTMKAVGRILKEGAETNPFKKAIYKLQHTPDEIRGHLRYQLRNIHLPNITTFIRPLPLMFVGTSLMMLSMMDNVFYVESWRNQVNKSAQVQCVQPLTEDIQKALGILYANNIPYYNPYLTTNPPRLHPAYRSGLITANPNLKDPLETLDKTRDCIESVIRDDTQAIENRKQIELYVGLVGVGCALIGLMRFARRNYR
ncbi:hypothetical protein HYW43_01370 [Candidatus Daviesbacteria bacterium]|nr:hypothetical protein [Candidatus Daviesbacteria bacterium]